MKRRWPQRSDADQREHMIATANEVSRLGRKVTIFVRYPEDGNRLRARLAPHVVIQTSKSLWR